MGNLRIYCLITLISIFIQSCIPSSTDQIEIIDTPDILTIDTFGVDTTGQIIYQLYQKYGFTDLEEQLILIIKPEKISNLTSVLPFDSLDIQRIEKIDLRKFIKGTLLNIALEKLIYSDIRIESKEFYSGQSKSIFYNKGQYQLVKTDTTEIIYVFDYQTGLMYIESKKWNDKL